MASPLVLGAFPDVITMPEDRMTLVLVLKAMLYLERPQKFPSFTDCTSFNDRCRYPYAVHWSESRLGISWLHFAIPGRFAMVRAPNRSRVNSEIAENNNRTTFMYKMMMASRISVALS